MVRGQFKSHAHYASQTKFYMCIISNGNGTVWSPIRSEIKRVMTESDDWEAEVRFVYRRGHS